MYELDARDAQRVMELIAAGQTPDEAVAKVTTAATSPAPPKKNKYGAEKVTTDDGQTFHSKREHRRYLALKALEAAGAIEALETQPRWVFEHNGVRIGAYTADFRYVQDGETIVEDVKSHKGPGSTSHTAVRLRQKMLKAFYGIDVKEVVT
jgi:hypothetical protein